MKYAFLSFPKLFLDASKHSDHSFERLIRSSRARSPFQREFKTSHRETFLPIRDTKSYRDSLPITTPYRSKSYHGELNRITHSTISSHFDDFRTDYGSIRSVSRSATNLNASSSLRTSLSSFHSSYVNAYSRHHSHHNHYAPMPPRTPVQINSRSRFRARNAYKAYRSRSANRLDDRDYSMSSHIRSSTPRARSPSPISHHYSYQDLRSTTGFSKSLSDIRTIQSRIHNELLRPLYRESSSIRNIDGSSEFASHILNPDIYLRWLKNKWSMEDRFRRERSVSTRSYIDDYARSSKSYYRDSSYPSRVKFSHDSRQHRQLPFFSKTIRGKRLLACDSIFFFIPLNSIARILFLLKVKRYRILRFLILCQFCICFMFYLYFLCHKYCDDLNLVLKKIS